MDKLKLESSIKLIRTLPLNKLEQSINAITNLIYDEDETLNAFLQKVDSPLLVCKDDLLGDFIQCEYNRDGDSHRSPHSNKYFPPLEDGRFAVKELRELEIHLNKIFSIYSNLYYSNNAVISCYVWELGEKIEEGIAVAILIKHNVTSEKKVETGLWDSSNFFTINFVNTTDKFDNKIVEANYKLTTTIMIQMNLINKSDLDKINYSGFMTRQFNQTYPITDENLLSETFHIEKIGPLVEEMETNMRNHLEEVYFKKTKEIIDTTRLNPMDGSNFEESQKLKKIFTGV